MRSRNLKPGFFKNDDLAEIAGPWGRLLYAGLWCLADREGRLEYRPKRIKAEIFPYDDDSPPMEQLLADLARKGFLQIYSINSSSFIQINKFREHQAPHPHEAKSKIPPPPDNLNDINVMTCNGNVTTCHGDAAQCQADTRNPDTRNPDSRECVAGPAAPSGDPVTLRNEKLPKPFGEQGGVAADPNALAATAPPPEKTGQDTQPEGKIAKLPSPPKFGPAAVASLWNELGCRPGVQKLTDARRRKLAARLRERADPAWWRELCLKIKELQIKGRDFLTFDFVIRDETNVMKVLEGVYDPDFKARQKTAIAAGNQPAGDKLGHYSRLVAGKAPSRSGPARDAAPA